MRGLSYFVVIFVFINQTCSVKVSVEGTVSLGKDVMDTLSEFLGINYLSGRRSLLPVSEDPIALVIRTTALCHNLAFCQHLNKFVEEFLSVLSLSLKAVLNHVLENKFSNIVFEQQLKHYLQISKNIFERANSKVTDDNESYYWIDTIKRICARFQDMAAIIVMEEVLRDPNAVNEIKDELNRKLIMATVLVEMKYQSKLCEEHNICIKSYKVTESLNDLLKRFETTADDKVRLFIRYFYETLFDTAFYTHVSDRSAHELQIILNDMAYSSDVPTKNILLTVQKIVETRLNVIETKKDTKMSNDAKIAHVILSDMDHIYSVHKSDPFKEFFRHFHDWLVVDVKIGKAIRDAMKHIGAELKTTPDDLLVKLISEVRTFLEITVEPEKDNS